MSINDVITLKIKQYLRIIMMMKWLRELKDTFISRNDFIRLIN